MGERGSLESEKKRVGNGTLHFSLVLPNVKLHFTGDGSSLPEIRRILEAVASDLDEQEPFSELRARLSEEFLAHGPLTKRLKSALLMDEEVRILKHALPFEEEFDLEQGKQQRLLSPRRVKEVVRELFHEVDGTLNECFFHIRGDLKREQQALIMDAVKQHLGMGVKVRFFSTRRNLEGHVLLEVVCFGEAIAEAW